VLKGSGPITLTGANASSTHLTLAGTHSYSGTLGTSFTNDGANLILNGATLSAASIIVGSNTFLSGNGATTGSLTINSSGHVDPGANDSECCNNGSSGMLNTANLTLSSSDLYFDLNGSTAGSGYDQITATGTVALGTTTQLNLNMGAGFVPTLNQVFTLINNTGGGALTGTFKGMPDGTIIKLNGAEFRINYVAGAGGDVTLTCTLAPKAWTGGGADNNWSTAANWNPTGAPTNGASLAFPAGASRLSNHNDIANLSLAWIALNGNG